MANYSLRCSSLVLGLVLIAVAGIPRAGAQGLSGDETAAINNLLGAGVLGTALPASPIANPASLIPLTPATWTFQFASGPNQGSTETDILQANTQPGAAARHGSTPPGQSTIYALGTAGRRQHRQPQRAGSDAGRADAVRPAPPGAATGNAAGRARRPPRFRSTSMTSVIRAR